MGVVFVGVAVLFTPFPFKSCFMNLTRNFANMTQMAQVDSRRNTASALGVVPPSWCLGQLRWPSAWSLVGKVC